MERSFVADAIAWMEQSAHLFEGTPDLDDESGVLTFSARGRNYSIVGAEYPATTTVLGDTVATFSGLSLHQIGERLLAPPKTSQLQQDVQQVLGTAYRHLRGVTRSGDGDGELSFQRAGRRFVVSLSETDYPRNTCVLMEDSMTVVDVPLPQYLAKMDQGPAEPPPRSNKKHKVVSSSGSGSDDGGEDDDDDDEEPRGLVSSGECCSEDLAHFAVAPMCPPLQRDVDAVAERFGSGNCAVMNQVEDQLTLGLRLEMGFLSSRVATAWGIVSSEPLKIALRDLSAGLYCAAAPPSVKIWQDVDGEPVQHGVVPQLQFIAVEFVKAAWRRFREEQGGQYMQDLRGLGSRPDPSIATLMAMGFSEPQAAEALHEVDGQLDAAVEHLTDASKRKNKKKNAKAEQAGVLLKPVELAAAKKAAFRMEWRRGLLVGLLDYLVYRLASLNEYCPLCDEGHMFGAPMLKPAICRRELCAFAFSKLGLLSDTVDGVATQAEVVRTAKVFRLLLRIFLSQVDLLVAMCKAAALSPRAAQVLDPCPLLYDPKNPNEPVISSVAKDLPLIISALNGVSAFVARGMRCSSYAQKISMSTMLGVSKSKVQDVHPLSFAMLQWVVSSNRSHLVRLGREKHLACMGTPHQFLLLSAPPEVEEAFSAKKAVKGTVWAFHGSRSENWHAILRQGVRNMSGTAGQLNGAAYGPGVYVSPTASMSLGYSQMHGMAGGPRRRVANNNNNNNNNDNTNNKAKSEDDGEMFLDGGAFYCLSICEIIAGAEKRHNAGGGSLAQEFASFLLPFSRAFFPSLDHCGRHADCDALLHGVASGHQHRRRLQVESLALFASSLISFRFSARVISTDNAFVEQVQQAMIGFE